MTGQSWVAPAVGTFIGARLGVAIGLLTLLGVGQAWAAVSASPRLVHRFMEAVISPDATRVASVEGDSPVGGSRPPVRELVIRRVGDAVPTAVALPCGKVPQCWPGSLVWAPDGKHVSFTVRTPGSHAYAVYQVAADGTGLMRLIDFSGTLDSLRYARDGRLAMLATANARKEMGATEAGAPVAGDLDEASPEQRIAILKEGTLEWVSPDNLFVYEYDWRPDGRGFVGTAAPGDGDNHWWIAKLYSFMVKGEARVLYSPKDIQQQIASPKVSPDGSRAVFIAGIMSDFGSTGGDVMSVTFSDGAAMNITPDFAASATALTWSCGGSLLAQVLRGDQSEVVDLGAAKKPVPARVLWSGAESLQGGDRGIESACPSGVTAVTHQSFTVAPEIAIGKIGHWRDLTHANTDLRMPMRVQSIAWKNEGFDIQGWLMLPEHGDGTIPMITEIHGGPAAAWEPHFYGPGLERTLLEQGYAIFQPNPRGSYGQGERFTSANVRDFGHGDLRDVMTGIDAAIKGAPIDGERLGLTGGSYGGFMSMWAVTQSNRFKAAVADAGISNWQSYYGENGIDAWMLPYFGASVYEDPAIYAQSSAINFIRNVRTPTLSMVGERDIECPAAQTQEFWHALKDLNIPTAIMIYPGEGHGLRDPDHIADAMKRTVSWFDRYLKR